MEKLPDQYQAGRSARQRGKSKFTNPNPYMHGNWAWWLAGWNDKDLEISQNGKETE